MNILQAIVIACLCIVPRDTVLRESVSAVHLNSYYDQDGKLVFQQAIYETDSEEVMAWRMVKDPSIVPRRDWQTGDCVATWMDGETVRQVRTKSVRESWLMYDPELAARESLPADKRRGLRGGVK